VLPLFLFLDYASFIVLRSLCSKQAGAQGGHGLDGAELCPCTKQASRECPGVRLKQCGPHALRAGPSASRDAAFSGLGIAPEVLQVRGTHPSCHTPRLACHEHVGNQAEMKLEQQRPKKRKECIIHEIGTLTAEAECSLLAAFEGHESSIDAFSPRVRSHIEGGESYRSTRRESHATLAQVIFLSFNYIILNMKSLRLIPGIYRFFETLNSFKLVLCGSKWLLIPCAFSLLPAALRPARVHNGGHHPRDHQQPNWIHHGSQAGTLCRTPPTLPRCGAPWQLLPRGTAMSSPAVASEISTGQLIRPLHWRPCSAARKTNPC